MPVFCGRAAVAEAAAEEASVAHARVLAIRGRRGRAVGGAHDTKVEAEGGGAARVVVVDGTFLTTSATGDGILACRTLNARGAVVTVSCDTRAVVEAVRAL